MNNFVIIRLFKNLSKKLILFFLLTFALLLISSYLETYVIGSAFPLINSFLSQTGDNINFDNQRIKYLQDIIVNFLVILVIISISKYATLNAIYLLSKKVCVDVSTKSFKSFIGLDNFLDVSKLSYKEQLNQCTQDIDKLNIYINAYLSFLLQILCAIAIIFSLFLISFRLSLLSVFLIVSLYSLINFIKKRMIALQSKKQFLSNLNLTEIASSSIQDKKEIQAYEFQKFLISKFELQAFNKFSASQRLGVEAGIPRLIIEPMAFLTILMPILFYARNGDYVVLREIMATTSTILFGLVRLIPILQQLFAARITVKSNEPPVISIIESLKESSQIFKNNNINYHNISRREILNINFNSITCADNKKQKIFSEKSIDVSQGESVVIIGRSGTGKSSFLESICGLRKDAYGSIKIKTESNCNTINLGGIDRSWAKGLFAYVPQRPFIFEDSIESNLKFFNNKKDNLFFKKVNKLLFIDEIYKKKSLGLKTQVDMHSNTLSGGEMQRIAIARAVLSTRPILILDECTSALDSELSEVIMKNLLQLSKERNTIIFCVNHDPKFNSYFDKKIYF